MQQAKQFVGQIIEKVKENYKISIATLIGAGLTTAFLKLYHDRKQYHQKIYGIKSKKKPIFRKNSTNYPKYTTFEIPLESHHTPLKCHLFTPKVGLRNPNRLILYFPSQKSNFQNNLEYIKTLVQYTISDVLVFEYQQEESYKNEQSMKVCARKVFQKAVQIGRSLGKGVFILGEDVGALLGLFCCADDKYRGIYAVKGLIMKDFLKSILHKPTHYQLVERFLPAYQWQQQQILTQLQNLQIPTMLILNNDPSPTPKYQTTPSSSSCSSSSFQNEQQILYYSVYKGRKYVYEIEYPMETRIINKENQKNKENNENKGKGKQRMSIESNQIEKMEKLRMKSVSISQKTQDNSVFVFSQEMKSQDFIQEELENCQEEKYWMKDMNYFMEIDIFMNNINF